MKPLPDGQPLERLRESAAGFLAEARLDRARALVKNVALLGPESTNGYRYTLEAMRLAVPLYAGRPVFIDHPDGAAPTQRKLRDYAGRVVEPRLDNERIRGDLQLLGPNAPWLLNLIEAAPSDLGMSHVALARRSSSGDKVEHIERILSVDIVAFPATTRSFAEARSQEAEVESPQEEELRRLVEASPIPRGARSEELLRLLERCPDPRQLLAELERYWQRLEVEMPRAVERKAEGPAAGSAQVRRSVIQAIRGH